MSGMILATKLYPPPARPDIVARERLLAQLAGGLHRKLTLLSAPAGFGKTTLVSSWLARCGRPAAWLSLDEDDGDPARFMAYLIAALQTRFPDIAAGLLGVLQSPQPPPIDSILTPLLNELSAVPEPFLLVLDDYHVIDAPAVDRALAFLVDHLPRQMHLVITTREDPPLNLARYRARSQMTELRVTDLRFTAAESAAFLNEVMGLQLTAGDVDALETRTEGWIAGLQLAAISLRGERDTARFIDSFTGSHRFVLDYLVEEVLRRQPDDIQQFLLRTSILERLCGPLCDALLADEAAGGQQTLRYLEQANLFIIPLDNQRRWYRYHPLFADLLRQQLQQSERAGDDAAALHRRASAWYEENSLPLDAFHHAAAAGDVPRAQRLIVDQDPPLFFRGAAAPILHWLAALPRATLDAHPSLWMVYAWTLWVGHQNPEAVETLRAAEAALQDHDAGDLLRGQLAALKAVLAANHAQVETIIAQSRIALDHLPGDDRAIRTAVMRALALAYQIQGNRAAAAETYRETIAMCEATGNVFINILAATGLGIVQRSQLRLHDAADTYRRVLDLVGEPLQPVACEACFGLASIRYEWNDLDAAAELGRQSIELAGHIEGIGIIGTYKLLLARIALARDDAAGAATLIDEAQQIITANNYQHRMPDVVAVRVRLLLRQGNLNGAEQLARAHGLPLSLARVHLASGDSAAAAAAAAEARRRAEARGWPDETVQALVLEGVALAQQGSQAEALRRLTAALDLAQPGDLIRVFVDAGPPMADLLARAAAPGAPAGYVDRLLAACAAPAGGEREGARPQAEQPLVDPLSERELEVLHLLAAGLSNREIGERLYIALSTVKGHNRIIYEKLQVRRRTEAVARARALGLL